MQLAIEFPLRVVIYPAPDMKGQWITHGLETDIVTQGDSPEHAMEMMADALKTTIDYAARHQFSSVQRLPFTLRSAPREVWDLIGESEREQESRSSSGRGCPADFSRYPQGLARNSHLIGV